MKMALSLLSLFPVDLVGKGNGWGAFRCCSLLLNFFLKHSYQFLFGQAVWDCVSSKFLHFIIIIGFNI